MTVDPFQLFNDWYSKALADPDLSADTAALATCTKDGQPSVRFLYFRGIREGGFSFFTNFDSRKGLELAENPFASMVFYWHNLGQQVRVEGGVERLSAAESDSYWQSRPVESQVSAAASRQSTPLLDEKAYFTEVDRIERVARATGSPIPRPENWGGFKIIPSAFEFWTRGQFRRHRRIRYERAGGRWVATQLYP